MAECIGMTDAVFLDRDGVINERAPEHQYVTTVEQFRFLPGVLDALVILAQRSTRKVIVVSNQACIGKGLSDNSSNAALFSWMRQRIVEAGGRVDGVYICPHTVEDGCWCRKPRPGLFVQAERELGVDLSKSTMIGDMVTDMQAAWAAGIGRCYWVMDGSYHLPLPDSWRGRRYRIVGGLMEAVSLIVEAERENLRGSRGCPPGVCGIGSHHGAGAAAGIGQR